MSEREVEDTAGRILAAAIDEMTDHGYAATTVRGIASRAGVTVPALYYHYASKQDMLERFMDQVHERSFRTISAAAKAVPAEPALQLASMVHARVGLVTGPRGRQNATANTELRSLDGRARKKIVDKRDAIQALFDEVVLKGVSTGRFSTTLPEEVARAINVLTVGIVTWFRPDGPLSGEEVADRYMRIALTMVECEFASPGEADEIVRSVVSPAVTTTAAD